MATPLPEPAPRVRIGELSDRVGESPTLLRAWERRYGLLQPLRSAGGFRLYGAEDERRVRAMQAAAGGRRVSSAGGRSGALDTGRRRARGCGHSVQPPQETRLEDKRSRLTQTLARFDDVGANAVLDRLLADLGTTTVISEVIVPYLVDLGERWADGSATSCRGAFRDQRDPRPTAGARPRLGRRQRPTRPLGMPKRRAARPWPDLLWDRPARPRLAHHLPGRRHPTIDPERSRSPAHTKHHRAGSDQTVASTSARPRGSNRNSADRHCR